jgi:hypothetical protein
MAWALSMGMIRSRESEFGRASSGPTSLRHRATGSKRTRQTRARPGRQTGCRTSHEFADRGDRQIGKMASWNVLFSGLRETGQERLHQLVRSLEALVLPTAGQTRNQFAHRCQTFVTAGPGAWQALEEAFDKRSDTEHLQDWNRAVQRYPPPEREDVCWHRTRRIERLA